MFLQPVRFAVGRGLERVLRPVRLRHLVPGPRGVLRGQIDGQRPGDAIMGVRLADVVKHARTGPMETLTAEIVLRVYERGSSSALHGQPAARPQPSTMGAAVLASVADGAGSASLKCVSTRADPGT